jgi:hypothetical protein
MVLADFAVGAAVVPKRRFGFAGRRHIFRILRYRRASGSDLIASRPTAAAPTAMVIDVT